MKTKEFCRTTGIDRGSITVAYTFSKRIIDPKVDLKTKAHTTITVTLSNQTSRPAHTSTLLP
jgi:hypothetical protein